MPPKSSNKKNVSNSTASWYYCEKCDVHITSKDRENHEYKCPIQEQQTETDDHQLLEYIRKGVLFTVSPERRKFDVEELKNMPMKYVNNLIFISEGAMRLAGWHIGQRVLIKNKNNFRLVRSIWPIPEKFLTTVFASEEGNTPYVFSNNFYEIFN